MTISDSNDSGSSMMEVMNGGHMSDDMVAMGLFWLVIGLLLATALVLGIIALLRYLGRGTNTAAMDTLKARYVKGEINREEYGQIKKDIAGKK